MLGLSNILDQAIINGIFGILGIAGGWWMNAMWVALKDLQKADKELANKVAEIDTLVAGQYVPRDYFETRMNDMSKALFHKLDRIEDKLDKKVDK